jgi:hypothetical protein
MGSDISSATDGHVQWRQKSTELQIFKKNNAGSAQNEQINSKKWSFALLLPTNPLSYTIIHNISMKVVAIGGLLSLTIG